MVEFEPCMMKRRFYERGRSLKAAVLGINGAPSAGDNFNVMLDEKEAKSIATKREQLYKGRD